MLERLEQIEKRYNEIKEKLSESDVIQDIKRTTELSKELSSLEDIVNSYSEYKTILSGIKEAHEMENDKDLGEFAKEEILRLGPLKEEKEKVPMMYPVGLVKGTYIICQNELGMYMIDQHAANERVNYEYYYYALNNLTESIDMLIPINIELPFNEYIVVKENLNILRNMHFDIEEFGVNSFIIRSHPIWLPKGNEELAIRKIIELIISKEKNFDILKFNDRVAMTVSCKASIKANDNISIDEMQTLINKLRNCKNPYTCPHGRPTIIFYSNYELEKLFKRAM